MSDEITFKGIDRKEALGFMSAIRKKASANGKQRDYGWMADVASSCFEDEAIAFFESLDVEVQQNRTLLSREILKHWPVEQLGGAPIPAAALSGPSPSDSHSAQVSGIVKVITDRGTSYLSRNFDPDPSNDGMIVITDKVDNAVRVTFRRSDDVHDVRFENDFPDYPLLGFHFSDPKIDVYTEPDLWAYLSPYRFTSNGSILLPRNPWSASTSTRVAPSRWRIERDGTMRPYVMDDTTYKSRELEVVLNIGRKVPFIAQHAPRYLKTPATWTSADLIFQPC